MTEQQKTLIDGLAEDLRPVVEEIESGIATTQNNYGRYGALLSQLSKGNKQVACVIAIALCQAGANREGVAWALKLFV
jgi:hypothetical protein